ncbi:extracellular solute-binding protein family 3 [Tolumonas auensis DSM 9187]|uniref:Extracellular solute-binding protein family 3 n=1 Tax=Tolumonas auensis (strain DSM 9187 / NBRC 110442 / TA 4) TaxID=595494 RepID=C4LE24_TOLAT|nr:amino acid ABC transporter substrate-binding protein [Tolumonas auensis]ACQ92845.1 extracellular solute-binding protein family 3 [Tolumonas auensis DSM 9187]
MSKLKYLTGVASAVALLVAGNAQAASGDTLANVKKKGYVQCGVNDGLPGFSSPNAKGAWEGMDVDVCRAVAAAVFADASKVKYIPLGGKERFTALQSGEVDILSRNTTWTMTRDATLGLKSTATTYYDGQGFMVNKSLGVKSAKELDGATICTEGGTTTEMNMADYFNANKMKYTPVVFDNSDQTVKGFESGRCDVLTSDKSQLFAVRVKLAKPDDVAVLPEIISKEPLGPMVRQGDESWELLVKWTVFAMINAEELGVSSKNVDEMAKSGSPDVKRMLGYDAPDGTTLGAVKDWGYQIVKQVGNYAEVFDRNVGKDSPLKIVRTENNLWNKGGFLYAPPVR